MADPAVRRAANGVADQSIGDLVSVAARDISQLVRYELDLAKLELKADAKRLGVGAAARLIALFAVCLVLMLLCFAFAFGLNALRHLAMGRIPDRRWYLPAAHRRRSSHRDRAWCARSAA